MLVSDILKNKGSSVYAIEKSLTLDQAIAELNKKNVGALVVIDDGAPVGILSERDVVRNFSADNPLSEIAVDRVMSSDLVTCGSGTTINKVMSMMTERRIRHMPVLDDGKMVGILSIGDVVKHKIAEYESEAEKMLGYISGNEPA